MNLMNKKIIAVILTVVTVLSTVSLWASAESLKLGDVNGDSKVNASDARLALRAAARLETLTDEQIIAADVNFDGSVKANDARIILRVAARLETLPETTTSETETTTQEPTTQEPTTQETTTQAPKDNVVTQYPEGIDALFSGKFYLEGEITNEGQTSTVIVATNGSSTEMGMTMEGFDMSIYATKKNIYIKFPYNGKNYYLEMDENTLKELGFEGSFNVSDITDAFTFGAIEDYGYPTLTTEELEGVEYSVYTFSGNDGSGIKFYADDNDNIKYIVAVDSNGKVGMEMKTSALTGKIPKDKLTLKGYNKGSLLTLMSALQSFADKTN